MEEAIIRWEGSRHEPDEDTEYEVKIEGHRITITVRTDMKEDRAIVIPYAIMNAISSLWEGVHRI